MSARPAVAAAQPRAPEHLRLQEILAVEAPRTKTAPIGTHHDKQEPLGELLTSSTSKYSGRFDKGPHNNDDVARVGQKWIVDGGYVAGFNNAFPGWTMQTTDVDTFLINGNEERVILYTIFESPEGKRFVGMPGAQSVLWQAVSMLNGHAKAVA